MLCLHCFESKMKLRSAMAITATGRGASANDCAGCATVEVKPEQCSGSTIANGSAITSLPLLPGNGSSNCTSYILEPRPSTSNPFSSCDRTFFHPAKEQDISLTGAPSIFFLDAHGRPSNAMCCQQPKPTIHPRPLNSNDFALFSEESDWNSNFEDWFCKEKHSDDAMYVTPTSNNAHNPKHGFPRFPTLSSSTPVDQPNRFRLPRMTRRMRHHNGAAPSFPIF